MKKTVLLSILSMTLLSFSAFAQQPSSATTCAATNSSDRSPGKDVGSSTTASGSPAAGNEAQGVTQDK